MSSRIYPRIVWVLMPSFKPLQIEVVKKYGGSMGDYGDLTAKGKLYYYLDMHETKAAAIAAGRRKIEQQQEDIAKRTETTNKRIAALDKAEGK